MGASLNQINAAIGAALAPLLKVNGGPFAHLGQLASRLRDAQQAASRMLDRSPALLVWWHESRGEDALRTLGGKAETHARSTWVVYIVTTDPRAIALALDGSSGSTGVFDLVDAVLGRLTNLLVALPATLSVALTGGAPGATLTFIAPSASGAAGPRPPPTLLTPTAPVAQPGLLYAPVDAQGNALASVTLDGTGAATIRAKCVTPGVFGDQVPGVALAWTTPPTGGAPAAAVASIAAPGSNGLWRNGRLRYVSSEQISLSGGSAFAVGCEFTADRPLGDAPLPDASVPYLGTTFREHLLDTGAVVPAAEDPIVTGRDS